MPKPNMDLRNMTVSPSKAKDVRDTNVLDGEAKPSRVFKVKNSTTEYTTSGGCKGPFGGKGRN